jgi:type IV pilus assembly protein PilA
MQREHLDARAVESGEDGFTLLELMMVVLIIGILIAVLTPTLLGATNRGKDRAMQTSLTNATIGAKSLYLGTPDYTNATPAAMTAETGGVTFILGNAPPTGQNTVSVFPIPGNINQVVLSGLSKSGWCFYVLDDEAAGLTKYAKAVSAGGCAANGSPLPTDFSATGWQAAW